MNILFYSKAYFVFLTFKIFYTSKLYSCTPSFTYNYEPYFQKHIENSYFLYEFYAMSY